MPELSGFTLFQSTKGWQLSTRTKGEVGWEVHTHYPDSKAQEILKVVGRLLPKMPKAPQPPTGRLNLRPAARQTRRRIILDDE